MTSNKNTNNKRKKISKFATFKLKTVYQRTQVNKGKRQLMEWEKIFAKSYADRG